MTEKSRTSERNREIHALCRDIAWHLCNRGIPLQEFIKIDIRPDEHDIKKNVFQELGKKLYNKPHTSDWTEEEAQRIIKIVKENIFTTWEIDLYKNKVDEDFENF